MNAGRAVLAANTTEKDFQQTILDAARALGWYAYHTHDSRRSTEPGFPDLVLIHPPTGRLIFAELKTERGRLSTAQQRWLAALSRADAPRSRVWRPSQLDEILEHLAHPDEESP